MTNITSIGSEAYNKYSQLPNYSYNCISLLMKQNEFIWKLLAYDDADAWKNDLAHPNLTMEQKGALVYDGKRDETEYRVFMDIGQPDAWINQATLIRIAPDSIIPDSRTVGTITMMFEVYSHYRINTLSNYTTRLDVITQQFLEVFNGAEIGGLGKLFFDKQASYSNQMMTSGALPFRGRRLLMSVHGGGGM